MSKLREAYNQINEKKFNQLKSLMLGFRDNINSFSIITAENPMGKEYSKKENIIRNQELENNIRNGGYGYNRIKGKYGNIENPFLIYNISVGNLLRLALEYKQESVIYSKIINKGQPEFQYWETNKNPMQVSQYKKKSIRKIYLDVKRDDYYSEFKGNKFIIPFFDDVTNDSKFHDGYLIDKNGNKIVFYDDKKSEIKKKVKVNSTKRGNNKQGKYKEMFEDIEDKSRERDGYSGYAKRKLLSQYYDPLDTDENNYNRYIKYNN